MEVPMFTLIPWTISGRFEAVFEGLQDPSEGRRRGLPRVLTIIVTVLLLLHWQLPYKRQFWPGKPCLCIGVTLDMIIGLVSCLCWSEKSRGLSCFSSEVWQSQSIFPKSEHFSLLWQSEGSYGSQPPDSFYFIMNELVGMTGMAFSWALSWSFAGP